MSGQDIELALYANLMRPICQYDFRALFLIVDQHILPPSIRLYQNPYIHKEIDLTFFPLTLYNKPVISLCR